MKLYTEDQVKKAIDLARVILNDGSPYPKYIILSEIKGIELPSDEEIEISGVNQWDGYKQSNYLSAFTDGAKWIIEQIKKKDL